MAAKKEENFCNPYSKFVANIFRLEIDDNDSYYIYIENENIGLVKFFSMTIENQKPNIIMQIVEYKKDICKNIKEAVKKFNKRNIGKIEIQWIKP